MEENSNFEKDLASIREIMERSVKFISLSGLSGIMAGVYAIATSIYVYNQFNGILLRGFGESGELTSGQVGHLITAGLVTLVLSLVTGYYFSYRKAKRLGFSIWNSTSKQLIINLSAPLITGGAFCLVIIWQGFFGLVASTCLVFYGLALLSASKNLFDEIRYLGYCEIVLGLMAAVYMGFGLIFWGIGFGVLHVVYGVLMYRKYDS